jgi:hypothetical protein
MFKEPMYRMIEADKLAAEDYDYFAEKWDDPKQWEGKATASPFENRPPLPPKELFYNA